MDVGPAAIHFNVPQQGVKGLAIVGQGVVEQGFADVAVALLQQPQQGQQRNMLVPTVQGRLVNQVRELGQILRKAVAAIAGG